MRNKNLPELLLPAGNVENFRAAIAGGADAIYLGLQKFNARGRASNFTYAQFVTLLEEAQKAQVKVYVTLNTVIKNSELRDLIDMLWFLSKTKVSAIIIQDWGVYHLLKKYFPQLNIHASTQMGNHNSLGTTFSHQKDFERVILARELTEIELKDIRQKSKIEIEFFTHGALCYSFSGMCLFSSYTGGYGANRGMCTQNCRRAFTDKKQKYLFSLKDNQLIEKTASFIEMGIHSIKIEGRMKSAEYVYTVAQAYRKALDNIRDIALAKKELQWDMGREKTAYFFGGDVSHAITPFPNTGILIGVVTRRHEDGISFVSNKEIKPAYRIRVFSKKTEVQSNIKIKEFVKKGNNLYQISCDTTDINKGDKVFLIGGVQEAKFSNKINSQSKIPSQKAPQDFQSKILNRFKPSKPKGKNQVFVRIDNLKWMRKIWFNTFDYLILNLSAKEWQEFQANNSFIQKNKHKIIIQLPQFIPETKISFYRKLMQNFHKNGLRNFMLSHLSQKVLLPAKSTFCTSENVYVFNDAAAHFFESEGATFFTYPLENDFGNYYSMRNRRGIVPLYFFPNLFFSRMPVKVENKENIIADDKNKKYNKLVRDGITIIRPQQAVSVLQHRNKLEKLGYKRFLIDFTGTAPSKNTFNKVMKFYQEQKVIPNTSTFNLRGELK